MQPSTEHTPRSPRVRFPRDVRVVPIGGPPRAYRLRATNLSKEGVFLTMTRPLEEGTRVALSLEASGLVLPFAQGEIVRKQDPMMDGTLENGVAVRFTDFLHPRAGEMVSYLVDTLQSGKPLQPAKPVAKWKRRVGMTAGVFGLTALTAAVVLGAAVFWKDSRKAQGAPTDRVAMKAMEEGDDDATEVAGAEPAVAKAPAQSAEGTKAKPEPAVEARAPAAEAPNTPPAAESPELAEVKAAAKAATRSDAVIAAEQGTASKEVAGDEANPAKAAGDKTAPLAPAAALPASDDHAATPAVAAAEDSTDDAPAQAEAKAGGPERDAAAEAKAAGETKVAAEPKVAAESKAIAKRPETAAEAPSPARVQPEKPAATPSSGRPAKAAASAPKSLTQTVADETREAALELSAKRVTKPASVKPATAPHTLSLPSGAVASLSWTATRDSLRIEPKLASGGSMEKVFLLEHPARLVFDVAGTAPKKSVTLRVGAGTVDKVRLGKQGTSTRIVVDLEQAPAKLTQKDGAALLTF